MKKFLTIVLLITVLVSCKDKKETPKADDNNIPATTIEPTKTEPAITTETTVTNIEIPKFKDPEVQKFANEYAAFIKEYKAGSMNPEKAPALNKAAQEWNEKSSKIADKLINTDADEAMKLSTFLLTLSKEMMP